MPTLLEFKNITFSYPLLAQNEPVDDILPQGLHLDNRQTLHKVSFSIKPGEWTVLLGANGSGKSTLARLANGLLLPSEGSVIANGVSSWQHDKLFELRKLVGFVAQDPDNQIVSTTVLDEVAFGPQNLGWAPKQIYAAVSDALLQVGLPEGEYAHRDPNSLSGGEKQRVVIAATLAMQPSYLVLDEPTAMLDPLACTQVLEAIALAVENGHGVLHITHHLGEAAQAQRVVVLERGQLVYDGAPHDLLDDEAALASYGLLARPKVVGRLPAEFNNGESPNDHSAESSNDRSAESPNDHCDERPENCTSSEGNKSQLGQGQRRCGSPENATLKGRVSEGASLKLSKLTFQYPGAQAAQQASQKAARKASQQGAQKSTLQASQKAALQASQKASQGAVFDALDLEIGRGSCVLLVGASGSGKSTLLSLAAGLLQPTSGEVLLNGKAPVPGQVGLVFQQPEAQLFAQTLAEDILFGPKNLGMALPNAGADLVDEVLSAVGLEPVRFKNRSPFSLSGGEARRSAIATILALKTDFLLLDEPTAGLDACGKVFIYELLQGLLVEGKGIVIATHDPDFFASLASARLEL